MLRSHQRLGRLRSGWGGLEQRAVGKQVGDSASLSACQLKKKVKDVVQKTIQNYRAHLEETAAEESWDYVQFQVREAPPTRILPSSSGILTWLRPLPGGDLAPTGSEPPALGP